MANLLPRIGFIDETSLKTNMAKTTGWSPKGARLIDHAPFGHWNTQTFIAALRHDRLDAPWVIDGAMNRELFELYVETQLAPTLQAGDVIILDNLSSHKSPTAADAMRAVGAWFLFRCSGKTPHWGLLKKSRAADSIDLAGLGEVCMLGRKERDQLEFFVAGSLRELLPDDHVLVRVDRVLDLGWLHSEVSGLYCPDNGRPGIDPEVAVRLMLAGFVLGLVQDRRLMREAQVNLAIRWFAGYGLHEALPDHSSLTRIRQRWGAALFRKVFMRIVQDCAQAGLITAETVHMDASLIRADVSMDALVDQHLDAVQDANDDQRQARTTGKYKKLCCSDPDATMATSSGAPLRPSYKQHTAVDDHAGVVVDIDVVTGEEHDTTRFRERIDAMATTLGRRPGRVTADKAYGTGQVYAALEDRATDYVIPSRKPVRRKDRRGFPVERFKYDAQKDRVRCPAGKTLSPRTTTKNGRWYRAERSDCAACPLKHRCIPGAAAARRVHITNHFPAILRARRKRRRWGEDERDSYNRHRWRVEGAHGTAKTLHGLNRAARRGLENMKIQALLTAIAMNLKKLAAAALFIICAILETRTLGPERAIA